MLAFTNLWILTTRPDRGHPKQQEDEINIIWQDARGGRLRLHQWKRRYGTVLQARGEALIYELAQEWVRILIPLTKPSRRSWRSFNFHMAPMKQLVTLSPSKRLVVGSRTTYFRICYRTSWVLFIRETVVCILIHPLWAAGLSCTQLRRVWNPQMQPWWDTRADAFESSYDYLRMKWIEKEMMCKDALGNRSLGYRTQEERFIQYRHEKKLDQPDGLAFRTLRR